MYEPMMISPPKVTEAAYELDLNELEKLMALMREARSPASIGQKITDLAERPGIDKDVKEELTGIAKMVVALTLEKHVQSTQFVKVWKEVLPKYFDHKPEGDGMYGRCKTCNALLTTGFSKELWCTPCTRDTAFGKEYSAPLIETGDIAKLD